MNRTKLKNYAPQARRDFIQAMMDRAAYYGLAANKTEPVTEKGDVAVIGGRSFPAAVVKKRKALEERIQQHGFGPTMEAMAYTWFNRLVAIRFMELHGYLDHGYRVLSHPEGKLTPEILEQAEHVNLPGLKKETVIDLKLAGNREGELYRLLLTAQCNALNRAMPFLFERIDDETELLLPDNLLNSDSLIRKLVGEIDEEDWQVVEIIGWLYQFYISERKGEVIGKVVASEDIPAATQLFTPNWIVKYLVQNTLGRQWLATYPQSALRQQMAYYIEPAEQMPEVQEQLKTITPTSLNPEELTLLDPACGSGHILVEAYDLFKAIYQERGYRAKDIPALILQKNLFGLEIDDRAAQLAAFALMMKARADDRRIFDSGVALNVVAIQQAEGGRQRAEEISYALDVAPGSELHSAICQLHAVFENAKTFGSLIQIPPKLAAKLLEIEKRLADVLEFGDLTHTSAHVLKPILQQARLLAGQYDAVVANPPYMGNGYFNPILKEYVDEAFAGASGDLYAAFTLRGLQLIKTGGSLSFITIPTWLFLPTYQDFREHILTSCTIECLVDNGRGIFGPDFGSCQFVIRSTHTVGYRGQFLGLKVNPTSVPSLEELEQRFRTFIPQQRTPDDFLAIPGYSISPYIPEGMLSLFKDHPALEQLADVRQGVKTGDIELFLHYWHEVSHEMIFFDCTSREQSAKDQRRWYPCNKGGNFCRWYGNLDYVINWWHDGHEIRNFTDPNGRLRSRPQNLAYFFKPGITWSTVVTMGKASFRVSPSGRAFESGGSTIFPKNASDAQFILGILNSSLATSLIEVLSPKISLGEGAVARMPIPQLRIEPRQAIEKDVEELVRIHREAWLSDESSYGFCSSPLVSVGSTTMHEAWETLRTHKKSLVNQAIRAEQCLNDTLITALGLESSIECKIERKHIPLPDPCVKHDTRCLLSYAVGCVMGRYSLDKPGLIYAHIGNQDFDPAQYKTFRADDDGIIPLLETDWGIRDDATNRIIEFIGTAWAKEHLEENLKFVADSLGPNNGEQPRETIRRYLAASGTGGFYKHHLSMYKKRPIYWLFSSGKLRAFQCLVYLHRYHEGTLARMRTEYVIPLQGQIAARIEQLEGDKAKATSTSHRNKLQKEQDKLKKQQLELATFEEKLKHAADQRIALDLDDGVKLNYGKFGDLLAEAKAITGGKDED